MDFVAAFLERLEKHLEQTEMLTTRPGVFSWGRSASAPTVHHDAIDQRRVVRFFYDGRKRVAEPHVLGTKYGRLQVLTWQTGRQSSSDPLSDWRRFFRLRRMTGCPRTDRTERQRGTA